MSFATFKLTSMTSKLQEMNPPNAPVGTLSPTSVTSSSMARTMDMPSPTSVVMSSSTASSTTTPQAATAAETPPRKQQQQQHPKASAASASAVPAIPKPFFLMDWLEEINPKDLEIARQMLQTPNKKTYHQSTPDFRRVPSSADTCTTTPTGNKSRSAIALPSLAHQQQQQYQNNKSPMHAIRRQLYPALGEVKGGAAATDSTEEEEEEKREEEQELEQLSQPKSGSGSSSPTTSSSSNSNSSSVSRSTSVTSTTSSSAMTNPPVRATPAVVKMSPFKRKSIAIGNGWNAKGLHKAKKGCWESALLCWRNALEIREQVLGDSHPDTANTLNNCGIALGKLGRFDEAIEVLERALEIRAKHYGTREHQEVAATLHNIGNVLHQAQDRAGAIQCFWDAKSLQEKILGPDHVQVARACVAIGNVYYEALQYDDAREAYLDALQVFSSAGLADDHAEVLAVQQDIGDIEAILATHSYSHQAMQHHAHMMIAYQHHHFQYLPSHAHAQPQHQYPQGV